MDYAKIELPGTIAGLERLPADLQGLAAESLADLSWTDASLGYHGFGYWPVVDERPALEFGQRYGDPALEADPETRTVRRRWPVVAVEAAELAELQAEQLRQSAARIAARRYDAEVAGIQWQGYGIATDRDSQNKVDKEDRAVDKAMREDGKGWKCRDLSTGQVVFRPTSNAEMQAIAAAVYVYVSACFAREAELLAALAEGTYTDELLAEGWPAQVAG